MPALKPLDQTALQATVDLTAKELLVPGAVVLLRTPQGEFTVTYGTTMLGAAASPRADTHFRIASNTKTMTAALIVQLAQEGKLGLGDRISKHVPDVPDGDNITIAELLEMRSGLYNHTDAPELSASLDRAPTKVWTPDELLAIAFARPPECPPGAVYQYNNTNYALLGLVAERVRSQAAGQGHARTAVRATSHAETVTGFLRAGDGDLSARVRLEGTQRDPERAQLEISLKVERAAILRPAGCSTGWPPRCSA